MKCPNDQSEMERGFLSSHGSRWVEKINPIMVGLVQIGLGDLVNAMKCPECGKVELYTETEKEEK